MDLGQISDNSLACVVSSLEMGDNIGALQRHIRGKN